MKRWSVTGAVHASAYIGEYEAETAEEAIEKAQDDVCLSLCHQCANKVEDPEIDEFHAEEIEP